MSTQCEHGKRKRYCVDCGGSQICIHKKRKERCLDCGGSELCTHNIYKYRCFECNGNSICIHGKRRERCKDCLHLLFCEHNNRKATCQLCKEERTCQHNKTRNICNICNPTYYHCEHHITKNNCKICSTGSYCQHGKYKPRCKECGGSSLCQSTFCDKMAIKRYNNYCLTCCIHVCPEIEVIRNYKTKERNVVEHVLERFPDFTWVSDKKVQDGCSKRRPDLLLDYGSHIIIVEIDENRHKDYESTCENKRMMEISQDVGHRPIVFIRFNPDDYINDDGKKVTSCWKTNKLGVYSIPVSKQPEWNMRIETLLNTIQQCIASPTEKTIDIVELFY